MIKPEGIPKFEGNLEQVTKAANDLSAVGEEIKTIGVNLEKKFRNNIETNYAKGPESHLLAAAMLPVKQEGELFGPNLGKIGAALHAFVADVSDDKSGLASVRQRADAWKRKVGDTPEDEIDDNEDWVKEENQIHKDLQGHLDAVSAAERKCANAIAALYGGKKWEDSGLREGEKPPEDKGEEEKDPPWGKPLEYDAPWYEDAVDFVGGVLKGVFVDGLLGTLDALTTLIPIQPLLKSLGVNSIFGHEMQSWSDAGNAWKGVGLTLAAAAMYSIPGAAVFMHVAFPETAAYLDTVGITVLKGMVAWDMWGEDPGRALGQVGFNVITTIGTGGAAGGVRAAAIGGKYGAAAAKVAKGADVAVNIAGKMRPGQLALNTALKLPKVSDLVIKVGNAPVIGDLAKFGGLDIPTSKGGVTHAGGVDAPNVDNTPVSVGSHNSSTTSSPTHVDSPSSPSSGSDFPSGRSDSPGSPTGGDSPASRSDSPASRSDSPGSGSDRSASGSDSPGSQSDSAASRSDSPGSQSDSPASHSDAPAARNDAPARQSDGPAHTDNSSGADSPGSQSDSPASHSDSPSSRSDGPGSRSDGPGSHADAPASRSDSPASRSDSSSSHADSPASRGDSPSGSHSDAPASRGDSPSGSHGDSSPTSHADGQTTPGSRTPDSPTRTPDAPSHHSPDSPRTNTPDAPAAHHTPDSPRTNTPDAPAAHHTPDSPRTNTPDAPRTPDAPVTHHTPDTPRTHTPDSPSTHTPDTPRTHTPDSPRTPDAPRTPDSPSTRTPDVPGTPDAPAAHHAPDAPRTDAPRTDAPAARTGDPVQPTVVPPPVHAHTGGPRTPNTPSTSSRPAARSNAPRNSGDEDFGSTPPPNSPGGTPARGGDDDFDWFRRPERDGSGHHDSDSDAPDYDDSGWITEPNNKNLARWITDPNGRPRTMMAKLTEVHPGKARHKSEQKAAGTRGGVADDQGGHGIGHRFFADQKRHQMFPQNKNFNTGAWKKMENEWETWIKQGHEVELQVTPLPPGKARPDNVQVTYTVKDKNGDTVWAGGKNFDNKGGVTHERFPNDKITGFTPPKDDVFRSADAPDLNTPDAPHTGAPEARNAGTPDAPRTNTPDAPTTRGDADAPTSRGDAETPNTRGDADAPAPRGDADAPANRGDADAPTSRGDADAPANRGDADAPTSRGDADAPNTRGDADAPASRGDADAPTPRGDADAPNTRSDGDAPHSRSDSDAPNSRADGDGPSTRGDADAPHNRADADAPHNRGDADAPRTRGDADAPHNRGDADAPRTRGDADGPTNRADADAPRTRGDSDLPNNRADGDGPSTRGDADAPRTRGDADAPHNRGDADAPRTRGDGDAPHSRGDSDAPHNRTDGDGPSSRGDSDAPSTRRADDAPSTRRADDAPSTRRADDAPSTRSDDGADGPDAPRTDGDAPGSRSGDQDLTSRHPDSADWNDANQRAPEATDPPVSGRPGQQRHQVEPNRYNTFDPVGRLTDRLRRSLGDNPLKNVDKWIKRGNPYFKSKLAAFRNNCGDSSRAFADNLQGREPRLANGDLRRPPGERREMYEYTGIRPGRIEVPGAKPGREYTDAAMKQIEDSLKGKPPGTVAIVGGSWHKGQLPDGTLPPGGGHWFNAFVDEKGVVRWADNQSGKTGPWPPQYGKNGTFNDLEVMVREPGGAWTSPLAPSQKVDAFAHTNPPMPTHAPNTPNQPTQQVPPMPTHPPHNPAQQHPQQPYPPQQVPPMPTHAPHQPTQPPYQPTQQVPPMPTHAPTQPQYAPQQPHNPAQPQQPPAPHQPTQQHPSQPQHYPQQPAQSQYAPPNPAQQHAPQQPTQPQYAPQQPQQPPAPQQPTQQYPQQPAQPHAPQQQPTQPQHAPQQPHNPAQHQQPSQPQHYPQQPAQQHPQPPSQYVEGRPGQPMPPHQPVQHAPQQPHAPAQHHAPEQPSRHVEGQPGQPMPPHAPEQPLQHPHQDGKVPGEGEIGRRLDPEGRADVPRSEGPSRIERALDPEGAARWDRENARPHPHQDGKVPGEGEIGRRLDPEQHGPQAHADPRVTGTPHQPHVDQPTHAPEQPSPRQPVDPRVEWSRRETSQPHHADEPVDPRVEWSQGDRQPGAHQEPGRPVDPRAEWSQGRRQPGAHQEPGQPVDPRAEWSQGHRQPGGEQAPAPHQQGAHHQHGVPEQRGTHQEPGNHHQQPEQHQQPGNHHQQPEQHQQPGNHQGPGQQHAGDNQRGDFGSSEGADLPPGEREVLDAIGRDVDATLPAHPEASSVVKKLVADPHKLNVTDALRRPWSRQATLDTIKELADGRVLRDKPLLEFLDENPGQGTLFEPIPDAVNKLPDGTTRKDAFVRESQVHDPARAVGAEPTKAELAQVREYQRRLMAADSAVEAEVLQIVEGLDASVSVRTKDAAGLIDKVQRMVAGNDGRAPRPQYKVGDVIDAIGARITVEDTAQLAEVIERVRGHYGFGDEGRILEVENMYAQPKAHNPAYRVVPMIVKIEQGGQVYTFELQLTTRRASIAADINHNTIYKPYLAVDAAEQAKVARMFEEAAALEQIENRGLNNG